MKASDWLLLVQTVVLAATTIPALVALRVSASQTYRGRLASGIRADRERLDTVADQIVRLSESVDAVRGARASIDRVRAEQLRLRALITPLAGWASLDALRKYATDDPTHASPDDVAAALDEVADLSKTLRALETDVLYPRNSSWWHVWKLDRASRRGG